MEKENVTITEKPKGIFKVKKPKGTFYSDYTIQNNKCYAIFELENGRVQTVFVCDIQKTNKDWKTFDIKENRKTLIINLNN